MTDRAERLKAAHRGAQLAAPASASRIASLEYHGLRYDLMDDMTVVVEGQYRFNIAGGSWVHVDEPHCHGYTVAGLLAEIKKRNPEKPAAGRNNVQAKLEAADSHQHVESVAGPISLDFDRVSASLLPPVMP